MSTLLNALPSDPAADTPAQKAIRESAMAKLKKE